MIDARQHAIDTATQLGVFPANRLATVFEDPFLVAPGSPGSPWQTRRGFQGSSVVLPEEKGGVARIDSGVTIHGDNSWMLGNGENVPGLIRDPGEDGSYWYLLWTFRIPTTPDVQTDTGLLLRGDVSTPGENQGFWMGVDGVFDDPTRFMGEEEFKNTTMSTISVVPGTWHKAEAWQLGVAKEIHFRFDGEPELTLMLTQSFGRAVTVGLTCSNGTNVSASQRLDSDHLVLLMDGNV